MRKIKTYATSFGFDFYACVHYKERVLVDEICKHIPENCFKHPIVVHIDPAIIKLLNYLIHEISVLHAV